MVRCNLVLQRIIRVPLNPSTSPCLDLLQDVCLLLCIIDMYAYLLAHLVHQAKYINIKII